MAQATTEINIVEVFPPTHARLCQMSLAVLETLTSYSEQIPSSPRGPARPSQGDGKQIAFTELSSFFLRFDYDCALAVTGTD